MRADPSLTVEEAVRTVPISEETLRRCEFRECRYCAQRIRPVRDGDGIDPADRDYYRWVDESGNPYCDLPPDGPEQIDLIHTPADGGEDECDGADRDR